MALPPALAFPHLLLLHFHATFRKEIGAKCVSAGLQIVDSSLHQSMCFKRERPVPVSSATANAPMRILRHFKLAVVAYSIHTVKL